MKCDEGWNVVLIVLAVTAALALLASLHWWLGVAALGGVLLGLGVVGLLRGY